MTDQGPRDSLRINRVRPSRESPLFLLWRFGWGPIAMILGFFPLALLNICQLASLVLLPFDRPLFRRVNTVLAWCVWGWWVWGLRRLIGLDVRYTGDPVTQGETAIVIANHQGMADIVTLLALAQERGAMKDVKFMAKNILKYVPVFGWAMQFVDFIFLKRSWADDAENIRATFARYRERTTPFWLFLFPEGTRYKPAKASASRDWAIKAGVKPTEHVMLPRPRGFVAALSGLSPAVRTVYCVTIAYRGRVPTLVELIRGDTDVIDLRIQRFAVDALPTGDEARTAWLTERFRVMDDWLQAHRRA